MISKKIKNIVIKYIESVKNNGIPVKNVYIFGSQVKGTVHKDSDIDVCIISNKFGKNRFRERLLLMKISNDYVDLIEPHPYSPKDFNNRFDPFVYQIKKTGIKVE